MPMITSPERQRQLLRHAVVLLVAGLVAAIAVGPTAAQESTPADRPALWSSASAAAGVSVVFNTDPALLPLDQFINLNLPYGDSRWSSSGTASALSGSFYPGSPVTKGPGLLCSEFGQGNCPDGFPPTYPLSVEASHPTNPDASTQTGGATAHAGLDFVETRAGASELLAPALGPLAAVADVGSAEALTRQMFSDDGSTVIGQAEVRLSGISLLGGVIEIDSLETVSISRSAGEGKIDVQNGVTVSGVTVAGQPAAITEDGVEIAGQGGGGQEFRDAQAQLNAALEEYGARVRLIGADSNEEENTVQGSARGIQISFQAPLDGPQLPGAPDPQLPDPNTIYRTYLGTITLGLADSSAFVSTGFGLGDLGGLGSDLGGLGSPGGSTGGTDSGGGFDAPPSGGFSSTPSGIGSTSAPAADAPAGGVAEPEVAPQAGDGQSQPSQDDGLTAAQARGLLLDEQSASRLGNVYLAFVIAAGATFAVSRISRLVGRNAR